MPGRDLGRRATSGAAADGRRTPGGQRSRPKLTGRGAVLVMVAVFLIGSLIGVATQASWLTGLSYLAGCLLAVVYARRGALLVVVTGPPLIFFGTLVLAELITAAGSAALATVEGTMLTLAAVAPWLFVGTAGYVAVAVLRGLPRCVRELRIGLSGRTDLADGPASFGPTRL